MSIQVNPNQIFDNIPITEPRARVQDILREIANIIFSIHKVPSAILIDSPNPLEALIALLNPVNVNVKYNVPLSIENMFVEDLKNKNRCAQCNWIDCPSGRSLLRCSRCQNAYYCCTTHQQEHWKIHRRTCK